MLELLIVDDDPLIQVGIKSMLDWESLGIHILGMARTGQQALDLMRQNIPDLIISDIKMPVMDGLKLLGECRDTLKWDGQFIVLTSYDDFSLAQQALRLGASDYLIKLEITEQSLLSCIKRATTRLQVRPHSDGKLSQAVTNERIALFFLRLLHMGDLDQTHIQNDLRELALSFKGPLFRVMLFRINPPDYPTIETVSETFTYVMDMTREILNRYTPCHLVAVDSHCFAAILSLKAEGCEETTRKATENAIFAASSYFSTPLYVGIGGCVPGLPAIASSYREAVQALQFASPEVPTVMSSAEMEQNHRPLFDGALLRKQLSEAMENLDVKKVSEILFRILSLMKEPSARYLESFDICVGVLYQLLMFGEEGKQTLEEQFKQEPDGYRCLYRCNTVEALAAWLDSLSSALIARLKASSDNPQHHLVTGIQRYIREHVTQKTSLQEIATHFAISPNYLSTLFKKYNGMGLANYISSTKVRKAQELLQEGTLRIYEISDYLGYENSYYFSKVFKKFTGISPKEYAIQMNNPHDLT
jgi:two-component system response regulator YesN